jgi:hypothetical protein
LNETFSGNDDEVSTYWRKNDHELVSALENMVLRASKGLSEMQGKTLRDLVFEFRDIQSVRLCVDGPAKIAPRKISLKPHAVPRRATSRRYAPKHLNFMRKQMNPHSRWSSPVLIVPKSETAG